MTTNLTVIVDGRPVPLDACGWIQRRPCGCIVAAALAVVDGGRVLATAEQADRELNPGKRERARTAREGITTELITMAHYREHIGSRWLCDQHAADALNDTTT